MSFAFSRADALPLAGRGADAGTDGCCPGPRDLGEERHFQVPADTPHGL